MTTCGICPGEGGATAAGSCSGCGRAACASHLVISAALDTPHYPVAPGTMVVAVFAGSPQQFRMTDLPVRSERERAGAKGWADGESLCTDCRTTRYASAVADFDRRTAARQAQLSSDIESFRAQPTAGHARELLAKWGAAIPNAHRPELWAAILPTVEPNMELVACQRKALGRIRPASSVPVWTIGSVASWSQSDDFGTPMPYDCVTDAEGRVWILAASPLERPPTDGILVVVQPGVAPQWSNGRVVNGRLARPWRALEGDDYLSAIRGLGE